MADKPTIFQRLSATLGAKPEREPLEACDTAEPAPALEAPEPAPPGETPRRGRRKPRCDAKENHWTRATNQRAYDQPIADETAQTYELFRAFRDLPPQDRTIEALGTLMLIDDLDALAELAHVYYWEKRALAYDRHLDAIRRKKRERVEELRATFDEERAQMGAVMWGAAKGRAEQLNERPDEMSPSDVIKFAREGGSYLGTGRASGRVAALAERMEHLDDNELEVLQGLLEKMGVTVEDL